MKNKTEIKKSFDKMIVYCEKAQRTKNAVETDEIKAHLIALRSLEKNSVETYRLISNFVNSFSYDMGGTGLTYSDSAVLLYVTLRLIYIMDRDMRGFFREDGRSEHSSKLAEIIMKKEKFYDEYGKRWLKDSWILDEEIYLKGLWRGLSSTHKTLVQNIVRGLIDYLYKSYNTSVGELTNYQKEFVEKVLWYTKNYDNPDGIGLPYI